MPKLSQGFVNKTKEPGDYRDTGLKGYCLRVTRNGTKSFYTHGRIKGSTKVIWRTIGTADKFSEEDARDQAGEFLKLMRQGIDPKTVLEKQSQEEESRQAIKKAERIVKGLTLRKIFEAWAADAKKTKDSTKVLYRQVIFKHLVEWLDKPMLEITPAMVREQYEQVASTTVASANNTFRSLRMLFNWAIAEYETELSHMETINNPVSILAKRDKWQEVGARQDAIKDQDLKSWFKGVLSLPNKDINDYFILLLLTGLRKGEAAGLRWRDVSFSEGLFIVRKTKNGRDHVLPMTAYISRLLKHRHDHRKSDTFVFPGDSLTGHIMDSRLHEQLVTKMSGIEFTPHALRRTFSLVASRLLPDYVVKSLMNHQRKNDVTQAHYGQLEADMRREPLKLVEAYILKAAGIEQPQEGDEPITTPKVLAFARRV